MMEVEVWASLCLARGLAVTWEFCTVMLGVADPLIHGFVPNVN